MWLKPKRVIYLRNRFMSWMGIDFEVHTCQSRQYSDLFDTLLLLGGDEAYYEPCLRKMHAFLVENGVDVSFEGFGYVYFEVRERFYSESRESLEEPHFNVRVSQVLQRLGYNHSVADPVVVGATNALAEEFIRHIQPDRDAVDVLQKLRSRYKLELVSNFGIPECARDMLERFGLRVYFDVVVISDVRPDFVITSLAELPAVLEN